LGWRPSGSHFSLLELVAGQVLADSVTYIGWTATIALSLVVYAIAGAFFSVFWTLVLRRLEQAPAPVLSAVTAVRGRL
jgi:hypothetical protein